MRHFARLLPALLLATTAFGCAGAGLRDPAGVARAYADADRFDEAQREIEIAVRQHPDDVALRVEAGRILGDAGNIDGAVGHLDVALDRAPGDPEVSILLGELEQRRDNAPDAYVSFRRAVALAPRDVRAVAGLAITAEALGFDAEAALAYERWRELSDDGTPAELD
jgi:tetratricopeptide (TPR) repeat protein